MEFGIYSFGDHPPEKRGAEAAHERIANLIAIAKLADEAGLAVFGLGEHHRTVMRRSAKVRRTSGNNGPK